MGTEVLENRTSHPGEIRKKTPLKYGVGTGREKMVAAVKQAGEKNGGGFIWEFR